ncbi:MAG: hypothetical protein JRH01_22700 [Deltaproteobacteria bacterium]|nr:hypothetical protein [Deltaproteobacteria bacterium]MBW2417443.1 hypothetical protein [Deltaproteobacteria bacterium]
MSEEEGPKGTESFAEQAARRDGSNLATELWDYLKHSDKWWLAPVVITILGLGLLIFLGGTGAAPFIYSVF